LEVAAEDIAGLSRQPAPWLTEKLPAEELPDSNLGPVELEPVAWIRADRPARFAG